MAHVITLKGKQDLSTVSALHAELMAHQDKPIEVDLSGVTQLGALCLQTLIAAAKGPQPMRMTHTSDRVVTQMCIMGVTPELIMEGRHEP